MISIRFELNLTQVIDKSMQQQETFMGLVEESHSAG